MLISWLEKNCCLSSRLSTQKRNQSNERVIQIKNGKERDHWLMRRAGQQKDSQSNQHMARNSFFVLNLVYYLFKILEVVVGGISFLFNQRDIGAEEHQFFNQVNKPINWMQILINQSSSHQSINLGKEWFSQSYLEQSQNLAKQMSSCP